MSRVRVLLPSWAESTLGCPSEHASVKPSGSEGFTLAQAEHEAGNADACGSVDGCRTSCRLRRRARNERECESAAPRADSWANTAARRSPGGQGARNY